MTDERETPINPYQSPRADFAAEEAAGPHRVYGLTQPIRIQGKLSAEDIWQKNRLTPWENVKTAFWVLVCLAVAVMAVASWLLKPGLSGFFPLLAVVLVLLLLVIWVFMLWGSKGYAKQVQRTTVLEETTFTEEGVVAEAKEGKSTFRWSAFSHAEHKDQIVVLYLQSGSYAIYPKRFFADESAWETFVGLVRCKVPEGDKGAGKRRAIRDERAETDAFSIATGGRPEHDPLIRARGALSWDDWRWIQRTTGQSCGDRVVKIGCFVLAVPFFAVVAYRTMPDMPSWLDHVAFGACVLFLSIAVFVLPPVRLRRQWKRQEGPFTPYEVRFWDDGVEFVEPASAAFVPWTRFDKSTRSDRLLLLHQGPPAMRIRWIPRSFLASDEEWERLLDLVREKLPEE